MDDFSAEDEEPWYDQQDLEQGERARSGGRRARGARPLSAAPLLGGVTPGSAERRPAAGLPWALRVQDADVDGRGALPAGPGPARGDLPKWGEQPSSSPKDRAHCAPLAHPSWEAGSAQGPLVSRLEFFGGRDVAPRVFCWEAGGACGGRRGMILSQTQRHPFSPARIPEPLRLPESFPDSLPLYPARGEVKIWGPLALPQKTRPHPPTAHGLGVRFGNSEQEARLEAAPSPLPLGAARAPGTGLEAGDEVAEVTSLRAGAGLLGPEGGVGLRVRAKVCWAGVTSTLSPQEHLLPGGQGWRHVQER